MQHPDEKAPEPEEGGLLVAIIGPTSSGKSRLAFTAAQALDGEIVNCDSMQMYRLLEIGTAKPTPQQRAEIPHHLYDLLDPEEYFGAGRYMVEARKVCQKISKGGKTPFVIGGTGLYLKALIEGVFGGPGRSQEIRERLHRIGETKGLDHLYRLLERKDPAAADRIEPADQVRIVRSLEVYLLTGRPISQLQQQRDPLKNFVILKIGIILPRPILYGRINRRVGEMFHSGLIEEVQQLLAKGYRPDCKGFQALGYRHAVAVLDGKLSQEEAIEKTRIETRRYAKRQMTWFRREKEVHWIQGPGEDASPLESLLKLVEEHHGIRSRHRP